MAQDLFTRHLGSPHDVRRYDAMDYGVNVTGLHPGQEYNITIVTITSPPPLPGQINASKSYLSRPPYRLSFQQPSGYVYKYKIVISDGTSTSTYHVNASEITLTDLKSGTLYFYSVTAYNKQGDHREAVVGSFKTQDDTDQLAVIIGPSVAGVIVIILITLSVVVIRGRMRGAGKSSADSNVEMTATLKVDRLPLARQNSYKSVPKASAPVPSKKLDIFEDNPIYEVYGTPQSKLAAFDKTNSITDDCASSTKSVTSHDNNRTFAGDETDNSVAIKDGENVYQNMKGGVNSVKQ